MYKVTLENISFFIKINVKDNHILFIVLHVFKLQRVSGRQGAATEQIRASQGLKKVGAATAEGVTFYVSGIGGFFIYLNILALFP